GTVGAGGARTTAGPPKAGEEAGPPPADRAGLDDERGRLGDRHEEARHLRVCDRDRAAPRDLPAEDRDDAAGRPQHVAEANGDKPGRDAFAGAVRLDPPPPHGLRLAT